MSVEAITWAFRQSVSPSSAKFVLVALANCASAAYSLSFPSIAYLGNATSQDRKTIITNLRRLTELGLIEDTGERRGKTKQVVVYRLCVNIAADGDLFSQRHYVYRVEDPSGQFYIGARTCMGEAAADTGYVGSGQWVRQCVYRGVSLKKQVIAEFDARERADQHERDLIAELIDDPLCMNRAVPPNGADNGTPENST